MNDFFFDHLDDDIDEHVVLPSPFGGDPFVGEITDPDIVDKVSAAMADQIAQGRELLARKTARDRDLYVRASQPGFFDWYLEMMRGRLPNSVRAEFVAQAALERRVAAMEELVSSKLTDWDGDRGE